MSGRSCGSPIDTLSLHAPCWPGQLRLCSSRRGRVSAQAKERDIAHSVSAEDRPAIRIYSFGLQLSHEKEDGRRPYDLVAEDRTMEMEITPGLTRRCRHVVRSGVFSFSMVRSSAPS